MDGLSLLLDLHRLSFLVTRALDFLLGVLFHQIFQHLQLLDHLILFLHALAVSSDHRLSLSVSYHQLASIYLVNPFTSTAIFS